MRWIERNYRHVCMSQLIVLPDCKHKKVESFSLHGEYIVDEGVVFVPSCSQVNSDEKCFCALKLFA